MSERMHIRQLLLESERNRPAIRSNGSENYIITEIEGIVIHWTANTDKGADAIANRNYFNTTSRPASAHYIVDDKQVIQCIPDNEVAWHVGDKPRFLNLPLRKRIKNARGPNYALIGIEMCVNADANWIDVYTNTVQLTKELMNKYDLHVSQIYRHYDITGKPCPLMFVPDKVEDQPFNWNWMIFLNDLVREQDVKILEKQVVVYRDREELTLKQLIAKILTKLWPLGK